MIQRQLWGIRFPDGKRSGEAIVIGVPEQGAHNEAVQRELTLRSQRPNLQGRDRAGDNLIPEPRPPQTHDGPLPRGQRHSRSRTCGLRMVRCRMPLEITLIIIGLLPTVAAWRAWASKDRASLNGTRKALFLLGPVAASIALTIYVAFVIYTYRIHGQVPSEAKATSLQRKTAGDVNN